MGPSTAYEQRIRLLPLGRTPVSTITVFLYRKGIPEVMLIKIEAQADDRSDASLAILCEGDNLSFHSWLLICEE